MAAPDDVTRLTPGMRRGRILHVISGLQTGGAEMMLWKLAGGLQARGWDQRVVSLRAGGAIADRIVALNIAVDSAELGGAASLGRAWRRARRSVAMHSPDLLLGWMYHGNLAALALRPRQATPVLWSIRQSLEDIRREKRGTRLVIRLGARLSRRVEGVLYNSRVSAHQHAALGYAHARTHVIGNGFDLERFAPRSDAAVHLREVTGWPTDAVVAGVFARWHPLKNHRGLIEAVGTVVGDLPDLRLLLAGTGVDLDNRELVEMLRAAGISDRVHLLGEVGDTAPWMAGCDFCVSASVGEGFPNVVGEAMACAVPYVVTDVGDSAEVVGDAGFAVATEPAAIADGIRRMVALGRPGRAQLGARARQRIAERYSIGAIVTKYEELLETALSARPGRD